MAAAIELFEFLLDGTYYRYNSGNETVSKSGDLFTASPIRRTAITGSEDFNRSNVNISMMRDNAFVVAKLSNQHPATVTIYGEYSEGTWATIWKGRITALTMAGIEAQITTESLFSALTRKALSTRFQVLCNHLLYDSGCGVSRDSYKYVGTVNTIDVDLITIEILGLNGEADDYYTGGYVIFKTYDYRPITGHTGNWITIQYSVPGLAVSDAAVVYPGCDHSETDCLDKFDNLVNYLGFPWHPSGRNPFNSPAPRKQRR